MKKLLLIFLSTLTLTACAEKESYEQAILAELQKEKDVKDYKIAPESMAKCIAETSANNMPGIASFDPKRLQAYRSYTKMLQLTQAKDPKKALEELRTEFGSPQELAAAHTNYTESELECYTAVISKSESSDDKK
jgi:PBP1b-binding outer membrane lipoprotein LpoB